MRLIAIAVVVVVMTTAVTLSRDTKPDSTSTASDNSLLKQLFDADQNDRKNGTIDLETVRRDKRRQAQVANELRSGNIRTANDHYHAAMVFQHGESADDIRLAFSLAWISANMDAAENRQRSRWLSAAAWDRIMMREDMPQWYGTQYVADDANSEFKLYRIDETAVTDKERTRFNVPVLSDARKSVEVLNRRLQKESDEPVKQ